MILAPLAFGMPAAPEWIFLGILALILFGPKKIPEIARGLGRALGEIQRAREDFQRELTGVPPMPKIQPPEGLASRDSSPALPGSVPSIPSETPPSLTPVAPPPSSQKPE